MYTHEWYLIFTKFWCCVMFSNPSSCYNITYLCITVMIKIHGQISIPLFIHFQFNDCFSNKSKDLNSKYNEKVFLYITLHLFLFLSWTWSSNSIRPARAWIHILWNPLALTTPPSRQDNPKKKLSDITPWRHHANTTSHKHNFAQYAAALAHLAMLGFAKLSKARHASYCVTARWSVNLC